MTAIIALRNNDDIWTYECLKDILFNTLTFYDDYYIQARSLMYIIPVANPPPAFKIRISHLSQRIVEEFKKCNKRSRADVLTEAAGRIFENLDHEYFHQSVKRKLRVELVP